MIRKTRLLAKAGVTLIRIERFEDGALRSTEFRLNSDAPPQTFPRLTAALRGFRAATRPPAETVRLRKAA